MTRAYIAEYGGLGANTDDVASFGTSCVYDSQGNLYVIGAASYGLGGSGVSNQNTDSLMLKYSPDGTLLFHKTWWDDGNQNCGATNVAIDIVTVAGQEYILWLANSWGTSGCFYGVMDLEGNIGGGGIAQTNAGINQTWPTDISTNSSGAACISTSWQYNGNPIPAVVSIPDIINSGTPGFSTGIEIVNTDASPSYGVFNAVVVDYVGNTFAIGNIVVDAVTHGFLAAFDTSGGAIWQYILDEGTDTAYGCYGESVALSPDGYLYSVVNDTFGGYTYIDKFEFSPTGATNIWRATIAANGPSMLCGYDINFDSAGNPIISGIASTSVSNGNSTGFPGFVKLNKTTGNLIFANVLLLGEPNETIFDGSGDPFVGHRCGAVYQDRFAFACTTANDLNLNDGSTFNSRVVVSQVPTDGTIATIYEGGGPPPNGYLNVTGLYQSSFSVSTTYEPNATSFNDVDLTTVLAAASNPMMATTNATTINNYSSELLTLGYFGGLTMRPGVNIRPGVTLRGNNTTSFSITLAPEDFNQAITYNSTNGHAYPTVLGTNGVDGFTLDFTYVSSDNSNWIHTSYVPYYVITNIYTIPDFFNNLVTLGVLSSVNQSALWSVTWAAGSSITNGYVIMSGIGNLNDGLVIAPVDTTVTGWNTNPPNNDSTTALAGTFLFPATFTLVTPAINKGGWC
jgi:hypothetical protein